MVLAQPQNPPPTSKALKKSWEVLVFISLMILGYSIGASFAKSHTHYYPALTIIPSFGTALVGTQVLLLAPLRSHIRGDSKRKAWATLAKSVVDFAAGFLMEYFMGKEGHKAYTWIIFGAQASINAMLGIFFANGFLDLFGIFSSCFLTVVMFFDAKKLEEVSFTLVGVYGVVTMIIGVLIYFKPEFATAGVP